MRFAAFLAAVIFCASCNKGESLFTPLSSDQTHINFENKIGENKDINMINYQYLYNGGGVGIGDFNNDRKPDIYFTSSFGPNKLYLNKGNFEFDDVTDAAEVGGERLAALELGGGCRGTEGGEAGGAHAV